MCFFSNKKKIKNLESELTRICRKIGDLEGELYTLRSSNRRNFDSYNEDSQRIFDKIKQFESILEAIVKTVNGDREEISNYREDSE